MKRRKAKWAAKEVLEIEFDDSSSSQGWRDKDRVYCGATRCRTVGYLLKETKRTITVVQSIADENDVDHVWRVPRGAILRMRRLGTSWKD